MATRTLICLAAAALLAAAAPAQASFPGKNGSLLYSTSAGYQDGSLSIWAQAPWGGGPVQLLEHADTAENPDAPRISDSDPSSSPTGLRFAFARWTDVGSRIYVTSGSSAREIPTGGKFGTEPSFGPDGRTVAFVASDSAGGGDEPGWAENQTVWTVRTDGTRLRRLRRGDHPLWTPGGRIGFADPVTGCLTFMRADGTQPRRPRGACIGARFADVSPDGRRLAYTGAVRIKGAPQAAIFVSRIDGSGRRRVTPPAPHGAASPVWSPDGAWIAYDRGGEGGGLFRVRPSGRGHARMAVQSGYDLAWQPLRRETR